MNRKRLLITFLILLVIAVVVVFRMTGDPKPAQAKPASSSQVPPTLVNYLVLTDTTIKEKLISNGTINADESVYLKPEASGKVTGIYFKEGSIVEKGALLLKINDKELQAQYAKALTRQKLSEQQEYRQRMLLGKEAISQQDYDVTLAELNSLKSETQLIAAQIQQTEIRAPFKGKIGLRMISEGDYVTPSNVIANLVKNNPVKITFSVPEKYAAYLKKETDISFSVEGNTKIYKADVYATEPSIDENTRTLQLRARAANDDQSLIPGSFAKIELTLKEVHNTILIPNEAVIPILKGKKVFISKNGIAEEVVIETGVRTDQYIQVTSGLSKGDTLITSGIMSLKKGASLKFKKS